MKKYIKPNLKLFIINSVNVLAVSGGDGHGPDGFDVNNPPLFN